MKILKVCAVVASRANYGRVKSALRAIQEHPSLELQLIVGASALLDRFGKVVNIIENDGFTVSKSIHYIIEGETLLTQAKSTGMGIIELSTAFDELKPDIVLSVADRFETMSTAVAATYMNIPLAHIQGGEVSGNIDDKVRHAISKLADIHFPATDLSKNRLKKMAELTDTIFNHGCPAMDIIENSDLSISNEIMGKYSGVGDPIDWTKPYLLMIQHPVTTSYGQGFSQIEETLKALKVLASDYQVVALWPNADAGADDVAKGLRVFRESGNARNFHFYKNFTPEDFARVLMNTSCAIGNSSSFLREGEYLGTPCVLVGDRQIGREICNNVVISNYKAEEILTCIKERIKYGNIKRDKPSIYGNGDAGKRIAETLATHNFPYIKRLEL
jgi:UDP-hydrolysing UDP-N-acetyl-D-glucosamine 2-epimerase